MSREIYLHEIIDIVGLGAWPYMDHTRDARGDEKTGMQLLGTWYTVGCTGRWSQVINLWELPGGWPAWRDAIDRLGLARRANQTLTSWWNEAHKHRTGGFDQKTPVWNWRYPDGPKF